MEVPVQLEMSYSELNMLKRVLEQYGIEAINVSKEENMYIIKSTSGYKCLKKIKHGTTRLEKIYGMTQYLTKMGFNNVPGFIKSANDRLYVRHKHNYFYMTEWIDGTECSFDNPETVEKCIKLLSCFQAASSGREGRKYFKVKNNIRDWPSIFNEYCESLNIYKDVISKKRIKSGFDVKYIENIDFFYSLGLTSIDLLNRYNYNTLCKKAGSDRSICHGGFNSTNLVMDRDGNVYIISLESAEKNVRILELGKLIQKLLSRDSIGWSFGDCRHMIEVYNSIIPISKDELGVLLAIVIFPYKFYKLGRKRYEKYKFWTEEKYMNKLNKLLSYIDAEKEFITNYIDYFDIDIKLDSHLNKIDPIKYVNIS